MLNRNTWPKVQERPGQDIHSKPSCCSWEPRGLLVIPLRLYTISRIHELCNALKSVSLGRRQKQRLVFVQSPQPLTHGHYLRYEHINISELLKSPPSAHILLCQLPADTPSSLHPQMLLISRHQLIPFVMTDPGTRNLPPQTLLSPPNRDPRGIIPIHEDNGDWRINQSFPRN